MKMRSAICWVLGRLVPPVRARSEEAGSAFIAVMILSGLVMLSGMAMVQMTSTNAHRIRRMTTDAAALAIAEAGVADTIGKLNEDYRAWRNSTNTVTVGEGTAYVIARLMTNKNVIITSVGTLRGVSRTTAIELLNPNPGLNFAIISDGDIQFRTAAFTITGDVHSNGKITSSNGAQNGDFLDGTVSACGTIGDLDATLEPNSDHQDLPDYTVYFEPYRLMALNNGGSYYGASQTFSGVNLTPPSGVLYVNGNLTIKNNSSVRGTIVVNGDIRLQNNFVQYASPLVTNSHAILCTGNVYMDNRGRLCGDVYAGVNAYISNNCDITNGTLVTKGIVDITNNTDIQHPMDDDDAGQTVIVGGWLM